MRFEQPSCSLERLQLDLADTILRSPLFDKVSEVSEQVLVISEGVLSYFSEEQASSLAIDLYRQPNFFWWILELLSAASLKLIQKYKSQDLFNQFFANEETPIYGFAPVEGAIFFQMFSWEVNRFCSFWQESGRLRRSTRLATLINLFMRCFLKHVWKAIYQQSGVALLERMSRVSSF